MRFVSNLTVSKTSNSSPCHVTRSCPSEYTGAARGHRDETSTRVKLRVTRESGVASKLASNKRKRRALRRAVAARRIAGAHGRQRLIPLAIDSVSSQSASYPSRDPLSPLSPQCTWPTAGAEQDISDTALCCAIVADSPPHLDTDSLPFLATASPISPPGSRRAAACNTESPPSQHWVLWRSELATV